MSSRLEIAQEAALAPIDAFAERASLISQMPGLGPAPAAIEVNIAPAGRTVGRF